MWAYILQRVRLFRCFYIRVLDLIFIGDYSCLHTINPRTCPLCRKAFLPERSKKLITGELPPTEAVNEVDLLKRLVISWDLEEEQLVVATTDVERWLQGREDTPVSGNLVIDFGSLRDLWDTMADHSSSTKSLGGASRLPQTQNTDE